MCSLFVSLMPALHISSAEKSKRMISAKEEIRGVWAGVLAGSVLMVLAFGRCSICVLSDILESIFLYNSRQKMQEM